MVTSQQLPRKLSMGVPESGTTAAIDGNTPQDLTAFHPHMGTTAVPGVKCIDERDTTLHNVGY